MVKERKTLYNFYDNEGKLCIENVSSHVNEEEAAIVRLISTSLRHGVAVIHLVNQLNKVEGSIVGFSKAVSRCLKTYIPDGIESKEKCTECGQESIIYEEGCKRCLSCGFSAC